MNRRTIHARQLETLKAFYELMEETRAVRAEAVEALLADPRPDRGALGEWTAALEAALESLETLPRTRADKPHERALRIDRDSTIVADLDYEFNELRKDLFYLRHGEDAFLVELERLHPHLTSQVTEARRKLADPHFNCFITDRDGTVNNYCGRYRSSIQSAYNAVFLASFARSRCRNPIILTSAPLEGPGLADVSVVPAGSFILAASKGREFLDLSGRHFRQPLAPSEEELLTQLNARLRELVARPENQIFGLIGSGLQFKFGQSAVARQDISNSAPEEKSRAFLETVTALVRELDPAGDVFRVEDTGLDIEIIVTIRSDQGLKDFDKGDAVRYLDATLDLNLAEGPHLVCGDTASDLPMALAAQERCPDTRVVFVTTNKELAARVRASCPQAILLDSPDALVTLLRRLA